MTSQSKRAKRVMIIVLSVIALVIIAAIVAIFFLPGGEKKEQSWDRKFNNEVSNIDINLGPETEPPAFEFHLNEQPPRFSAILCIGERNSKQLQKDSWNTFFNKVAEQVPAYYKPEFTDLDTADGRKLARVMVFVDLRKGADSTDATDVARRVADVMREFSPCK